MALIKCPECGAKVSNKAQSCVQCGYPLQAALGVVSYDTIYCKVCPINKMRYDNDTSTYYYNNKDTLYCQSLDVLNNGEKAYFYKTIFLRDDYDSMRVDVIVIESFIVRNGEIPPTKDAPVLYYDDTSTDEDDYYDDSNDYYDNRNYDPTDDEYPDYYWDDIDD